MNVVRSRLFSQYESLLFGMSTRGGGISPGMLGLNLSYNVGDEKSNVDENRRRFFASLGVELSTVAFPQQCHSNLVRSCSSGGIYKDCDSLVTDVPDVCIAVSVADCLPIFLFDPVTSSMAGIHAGWRGSSTNIVAHAVQSMKDSFRTDPSNLVAFIGPSASQCCYQVGEEVAKLFQTKYMREAPGDKYFLDLKGFNKKILLENGLQEHNIEVHSDCTICSTDIYHSFRRDGQNSGRMLAVIGLIK